MEALSMLGWAFDGLLLLGLLGLGWQALACPDLFRAIVCFIAFGLLMALSWVRLEAPDVALAEAAIGAGLTGALLLTALAQLRRRTSEEGGGAALSARPARVLRVLSAGLLLAATAGLAYAVLTLPSQADGLASAVAAQLAASGVSNPVTAVLLNFRAYDTLLETVVLLLALLGVWALGGLPAHDEAPPGAVLDALARLLTPLLILVAAYLLWAGAHAPGGAFQAGSVLGAAGVMLLLAGRRPGAALLGRPLRLALLVGPGLFVATAATTLLAGLRLLEYPPDQAGILILLLETAATLSIGATLAALFLGAAPEEGERR